MQKKPKELTRLNWAKIAELNTKGFLLSNQLSAIIVEKLDGNAIYEKIDFLNTELSMTKFVAIMFSNAVAVNSDIMLGARVLLKHEDKDYACIFLLTVSPTNIRGLHGKTVAEMETGFALMLETELADYESEMGKLYMVSPYLGEINVPTDSKPEQPGSDLH